MCKSLEISPGGNWNLSNNFRVPFILQLVDRDISYLIYCYHSEYCLFSYGQSLLFMVGLGFDGCFRVGLCCVKLTINAPKIAVCLTSISE